MNIFSLFADDIEAQKKALGNNIPHLDLTQASLNTILGVVYMLAGALAVIFIVIGGIRYITSNGNSSSVATAKNTIMYAIIGLVIVILAYTITNFVLGSVNVSSWTGFRDSIINTLLYVAGALAVIMIIFGAFRYVTSGGNSSSVTAAKNTILYAVVGLIIAVLAYAIVNFVIGSF